VKSDQTATAVAMAYSRRHGVSDCSMKVAFDWPVPAEYPDDVGMVISFAKEVTVRERVLWREDFWSRAPESIPLVAPSREEASIQTKAVHFVHGPVDVSEVSVGRMCGVVINQRQKAVSIGTAVFVFSKDHRLDDSEAFGCAIVQVDACRVAVKAVKQFPSGIRKVEKRLAAFIDEVSSISAYY
jgi:hypothetical protein